MRPIPITAQPPILDGIYFIRTSRHSTNYVYLRCRLDENNDDDDFGIVSTAEENFTNSAHMVRPSYPFGESFVDLFDGAHSLPDSGSLPLIRRTAITPLLTSSTSFILTSNRYLVEIRSSLLVGIRWTGR